VSVCVPVVAKDVFKTAVALAPAVAVAPTGVTVAVPRLVVPSMKVTFPVGPAVLLDCVLMATDKVMPWLVCTVVAPAVTTVAVVALDTVTVSATGVVTAL
jgi:hypothetical protein